MPGVLYKLSWRINLLTKALRIGGQAEWKMAVLREMLPTHSKDYLSPHLKEKKEGLGLYQIGGQVVWFPLSFDPSILGFFYDEIFIRNIYESKSCCIGDNGWVVDAGACEGFFTLYALEKGANVLVFEPIPELVRALKQTLKTYIEEGRAIVFPMGLGSRAVNKEMTTFYHNVGASSFSNEKAKNTYVPQKSKGLQQTIDLDIVTLDSIIQNSSGFKISFIKADVEGYERELLKGAKDTIFRDKPSLSVCTYHLPDDPLVIPRLIRNLGVNYRLQFSQGLDVLHGIPLGE